MAVDTQPDFNTNSDAVWRSAPRNSHSSEWVKSSRLGRQQRLVNISMTALTSDMEGLTNSPTT
jgi:hypothetical protein